jgi:hypothetical protein
MTRLASTGLAAQEVETGIDLGCDLNRRKVLQPRGCEQNAQRIAIHRTADLHNRRSPLVSQGKAGSRVASPLQE